LCLGEFKEGVHSLGVSIVVTHSQLYCDGVCIQGSKTKARQESITGLQYQISYNLMPDGYCKERDLYKRNMPLGSSSG